MKAKILNYLLNLICKAPVLRPDSKAECLCYGPALYCPQHGTYNQHCGFHVVTKKDK